MKKIVIAAFSLLFSLFASAQTYKLMWEDNFDNPVLNETQHWTAEVNGDGGGNNELQYYRRENISIEQHPSGASCLVISAKRENFGGKVVTSGRLVTRGNVSCKYGKIEARIKLPSTANGLWPAFWMMGEDFSSRGWPRCGEIDILEMGNSTGIAQGTQDRYFNGACHWGETWTYYAKSSTSAYSLQNDFHLFTLIWDKTAIKMYVDLDENPTNLPYYEMSIAGDSVAGNKTYYFNKPFSILFNLAVGGNFTGITGNANVSKITALPADGTPVKMYVDYVRIYQRGDVGEIFNGPTNTVDNEAPTSFSASKGAITPNSIELLLSATDNSGSVFYEITNGSSTTIVKGTSGIQTSYVVSGLNSSTLYNFSIVAKDANGNVAANNPITVSATTGATYTFLPIDFETVGQDWTWTSFGNGDNATSLYSVVTNPSVSGKNTSAHCAKYIVNSGAMSWAGLYSDNIGSLTFTPDNCKVKVLVYKNFISNFDLKLENGSYNVEKLVPNTLINQWEELTFDMTDQIGKTITRMTLIPDNSTVRSAQRISYWDNISFTSGSTNAVNEVKAENVKLYPNPILNVLKVKSLQEINQIIVRDVLGQTIKINQTNCNETTIDLTGISAGNYFVTVKLSNGQTSTQKITKL
ncbi:MAG: family 16 glycosylhydrolase [Paludibacter sp.]|nr:family 16 glycosylhydrolase [Paludibacter sp.]